MLTIILGPGMDRLRTTEGKVMVVIQATTIRANQRVRLNSIVKFDSVTDVSIVIRKRLGHSRLKLNTQVKNAIVEFLNRHHGHNSMEFDCYAFANLVHQQPIHSSVHLLDFWDIESATELAVGGAAFFLDPDTSYFYHAAIYLGHGVFVSVYGRAGYLEFSTLEDMQRDFGPSTAAIAIPRKTATS